MDEPNPLAAFSRVDSARLTLRAVQAADIADLLEINGDPEVTRFLPYATWQSLADGEAWLSRMVALGAASSGQQLVVARRVDAKVIGTMLLFKYDPGSSRVELGYVLGRSHWGQGLMREAIVAACSHAFAALGIRRIEAEVNPANLASCALMEAVGFTREGTLRKRWVAKGVAYDTHLYGCLADDWPTARAAG